jgi:peroxiredoxin
MEPVSVFPSLHDGLVCDFSVKRYKKELRDLNKLIRKAEELVADQSIGTRAKFVKRVSKEKIVWRKWQPELTPIFSLN